VSANGPHDVGGSASFGAIDTHDDGATFHHEWEARVFAINRMLLVKGVYTLDEFRFAIEAMEPARYYAASYYERWLCAIESLLAKKGVATDV
jgi:nitrile hydratase